MTTAAHPRVPAAWVTSDVTSCCTAAVYKAIEAIPQNIITMLQSRPSRFERGLGAFPKVLAKCGRKMRKKGAKAQKGDGEGADGET